MAAESKPDKLEVDNSDFQSMLRESMEGVSPEDTKEVVADTPERRIEDLTSREPEEKEPVVSKVDDRSQQAPDEGKSDDVTRALSTISTLEREVADLRSRVQPRQQLTRSEPQIEMIEVIPGVTLPKDQRAWPVQLTPDLVKAAGLDPEVAPGLNILANAFLVHINNLLAPAILNQVQQDYRSRETVNGAMAAFFNKFPDLKGQDDILEVVENHARNTDRIHEKFAGTDYMDQVGQRTRARIASLRGQTVQQYEASLNTNARPATQPSRATTSPVRRAQRVPASTDANDRELQDMFNR